MTIEEKLRKEIVKYGRLLYERGLNTGIAGNISARVDDDRILITPSGRCKGFLKENEILIVTIKDGKVSGKGKPSIETPMHIAIYEKRKDVGAVIHTHPVYSTVLAVAGITLKAALTPEGSLILGKVPLVPYRTPGTRDLGECVAAMIGNNNACLLEKHGALSVGSNLEEAFLRLETLEFLATIQVHLSHFGEVEELPEEALKAINTKK
ncbi:MAG: class II aldolase/adducin family protein [Methanomassiliicoccales archaeon]|nr:class II aldolase/adducin family protein [Methanomassiliicoccales archaeon]